MEVDSPKEAKSRKGIKGQAICWEREYSGRVILGLEKSIPSSTLERYLQETFSSY